jgi:hypothetical protein
VVDFPARASWVSVQCVYVYIYIYGEQSSANGGTSYKESQQIKELARASAGHEELHRLIDEFIHCQTSNCLDRKGINIILHVITQWTGTGLLIYGDGTCHLTS